MGILQNEWFIVDTPGDNTTRCYPREEIESAVFLTITPHITDSNGIRLEMALAPHNCVGNAGHDYLPIVLQTIENPAVVEDGGTLVLAGLPENRTGQGSRSSRELVVFVTAHLRPNAL